MTENKNELVITRVFDAPVETVWKYWTDPETFKKWWGPKDFTCPVAKIDFRVGGKYHVAMHGPAGGEFDKDLWSTGTYQEIDPMKKIVVTDSFADEKGDVVPASYYGMLESFPMETTISITFEQHPPAGGGKTKMTLYYPSTEGIEGKMLDDMTQGWNQSFDKLKTIVLRQVDSPRLRVV
ncbi:SRPBCC domain-containing protein [Candidatus Microgenomates bacterium]|nr:SRPBCC domain-containing protein [Candidatus Microgenomates bacterium]